MSDSIRERVVRIAKELRDNDALPSHYRDYMAEVTGLIPVANIERLKREIAFKVRLQAIRQTTKSAADARMLAETEPVYQEWQEAVIVCESLLEMKRTCRDSLESLDSEMRLT